ncbi:BAI1-associated protein 3-like [Uloborus diversus]|uniref:BAI1-associated protein 3-like n=1 Tax=Uloborus diversus TaxID=327109 RepID=UPI0024094DA3|nr:BAI1-associated protein 3-like [Uloborus diversus]
MTRYNNFMQDEGDKEKPPPAEPELASEFRYEITQKEWENLYVEVLYTIRHKLGANSSSYESYTEDMYEYARETFYMSQEEHAKFMAIAEEEKPPISVLNVTVMEARGLEAKDPNGFSDPYCMLGIQTDPDRDSRRRSDGDEEGSHRRSLKRFGASFKRKDKRDRSNSDVLPAKFIRTTTVKKATLNPRWREKFRLDIDDARSDRLHLDIWDHDDETSVFDAARRLNEVSNLKGLGRYFKEVAQSARTSIGDNVDDFLGCVNIPLEEIPAAGINRWFPLHGRSQRSNVQGQIHLKLQLGTREDRGLATGDDNWREVMEHQQLIFVFISHEIKVFKGPVYKWPGDLPQQALTILHQHAIQGDITELQQSVCQWVSYFRKHQEDILDYSLMFQHLEELATNYDKNEEALSMDEESVMSDTFKLFADHCISLLRHHRRLFPAFNYNAGHKLKFMLKCLNYLYSMAAFKTSFPFRNDLHVEITNALKKGTLEWMRDTKYRVRKEMIAEEVCRIFGREAVREIHFIQRNQHLNETAHNRVHLNKFFSTLIETDVFELFLVLQEFNRYKDCLPEDERMTLFIASSHLWFIDAIDTWFAYAKCKVRGQIYISLERDKMENPDKSLKCSVSAIDTVLSFIQMREFWNQLCWPVKATSFPYLHTITQKLSPTHKQESSGHENSAPTTVGGVILYTNLSWKRLKGDSTCFNSSGNLELSNKPSSIKENLDYKPTSEPYLSKGSETENMLYFVLLYVNNMDHVLSGLNTLKKDLDFEGVIEEIIHRDGQTVADECRAMVDTMVTEAADHVHTMIESVLNNIADQMKPPIRKLIFHMAWAPEKLEPEKCIAPLLDFLEKSFSQMNTSFLNDNFQRLLQAVWRQVLAEISYMSKSNVGKERCSFFLRLHTCLRMLVDFFHKNGTILHIEHVQNSLYQELEKDLRLHKSTTLNLVEMYYLQRMNDQVQLTATKFGCLSVNAYYDDSKEAICIQVISANNLLPCDPNGLSDPFVIIELVPKHLFPNASPHRTKTIMKTLTPVFNEYFEWKLEKEKVENSIGAINFIVMDYDYMRPNDFEGEAYIPLSLLPGCSSQRVPAPVTLLLMSPNPKKIIQEEEPPNTPPSNNPEDRLSSNFESPISIKNDENCVFKATILLVLRG